MDQKLKNYINKISLATVEIAKDYKDYLTTLNKTLNAVFSNEGTSAMDCVFESARATRLIPLDLTNQETEGRENNLKVYKTAEDVEKDAENRRKKAFEILDYIEKGLKSTEDTTVYTHLLEYIEEMRKRNNYEK